MFPQHPWISKASELTHHWLPSTSLSNIIQGCCNWGPGVSMVTLTVFDISINLSQLVGRLCPQHYNVPPPLNFQSFLQPSWKHYEYLYYELSKKIPHELFKSFPYVFLCVFPTRLFINSVFSWHLHVLVTPLFLSYTSFSFWQTLDMACITGSPKSSLWALQQAINELSSIFLLFW